MIYAIGVDGDYTFHEFIRQCIGMRQRVVPINMRAVVLNGGWRIDVTNRNNNFVLVGDQKTTLNADLGYFFRPCVPSVVDVSSDEILRWENLVQGLSSWFIYHRVGVVNAPSHRDFNGYKSLHQKVISQFGLRVPRSLTTANADLLYRFCSRQKSVLKAHCGVRATTRLVSADEVKNYNSRQGPIHVQAFISGYDLRVHVVRRSVYTTKIVSRATDYRADVEEPQYSRAEIDRGLKLSLVDATEQLGLILAGWDFKVDSDGQAWALEVNSMPGYAGYDHLFSGAITREIISILHCMDIDDTGVKERSHAGV